MLQAITPLRELGMVWPREATSQVQVLVVLIANKTGRIYSSLPSAKFLTYGGVLLCLLLTLTTLCIIIDTSTKGKTMLQAATVN